MSTKKVILTNHKQNMLKNNYNNFEIIRMLKKLIGYPIILKNSSIFRTTVVLWLCQRVFSCLLEICTHMYMSKRGMSLELVSNTMEEKKGLGIWVNSIGQEMGTWDSLSCPSLCMFDVFIIRIILKLHYKLYFILQTLMFSTIDFCILIYS